MRATTIPWLQYVLLQQDNKIAKQSIEIERLSKENEQLRGGMYTPVWY